jgi:hypothetical protein
LRGFDVRIQVDGKIAAPAAPNPGLRRLVKDPLPIADELAEWQLVEVAFDETEMLRLPSGLQVLLFQSAWIVGKEAVDPDHVVPFAQQSIDQVRADEARSPRDENAN